MTKPTKAETAEILAERDYWQEFAGAFDWRLIGWDRRSAASFSTGRMVSSNRPSVLDITGSERDRILEVLTKAGIASGAARARRKAGK